MNSKLSQVTHLLNERLKLPLSISLGIFLFILFFQPFPLDRFDFNNRLLFVAGFGGIAFLIMFLISIAMHHIIKNENEQEDEPLLNFYLEGLLILILCSVAFTFYLRYVGSVSITFFIVFKIVLVCLFPPVVLMLSDRIKGLIQQNNLLAGERKTIQKQIEKYEEDNLNKSISFVSETGNEDLTLLIAELVFVQSADNYVEIAYSEDSNIRKKLIRNTLKNIEIQLKQYSNFIRCHRTYLVNLNYIEKLHQDFSSHWITIKGYPEKIPVSRQYLQMLRERL